MKATAVSVSLEPQGSTAVVKPKGHAYVALTPVSWQTGQEKERREWRWAVACDTCTEYVSEFNLLSWHINAFEAADRHDQLFHGEPDQKEDDLCVCAAQRNLHVAFERPSSRCESGFTLMLCKGCGQKPLDGWYNEYHRTCEHTHKWAPFDDSDYDACRCNATSCELCGQDYTEYLEGLLQAQAIQFNRWKRE